MFGMSWVTALATFGMVAGITLCIVVLAAIASLRKSLGEGALRQAQQIKRLVETVAVLHQQQQNANARIQILTESNRRLAEEVSALQERVGDAEGMIVPGGSARLLH